MKKLILFIFAILLMSCGSKKDSQQEKLNDNIDTDSLFVSLVVSDVMNKIEKVKDKDFYVEDYTFPDLMHADYIRPDMRVNLSYGYIFSDKHKHLKIKCENEIITSLKVFLLKEDRFEEVVFFPENYYGQTMMAYIGDTIYDVNGDGLKDYDTGWYPGSGCCRRNVHFVYLLKEDGTFSEQYEFINPIFYPKEKIIRGVGYGYEGMLYKYRWSGGIVDTIEHIWQYADYEKPELKPQYFRISAKGDTVKIPAIPKEYLTVNDIDWLNVTLEEPIIYSE